MNRLFIAKILLAILVVLTATLMLIQHHEEVVDAQIKAAQDARRPATPEEREKEADSMRLDDKKVQDYRPK